MKVQKIHPDITAKGSERSNAWQALTGSIQVHRKKNLLISKARSGAETKDQATGWPEEADAAIL